MDIKTIIAKSKQKRFLGEGDTAIRLFIDAKVQEMTQQVIEEITPEIVREAKKVLNNELTELRGKVFKGEPGEPGRKGDKGDAYRLTENDKDEIASKIDVPIVEKITERVEVMKPVVTEVAKYETADEIVKKINSKEESIEIKTVKGLTNWINNFKKALKEKGGGGGGMGNWVNEQVSGAIDDSNTSFSISYNVASNGQAIILTYQGQPLEIGNHYTLSGRTITTTFVPTAGTTLYAMYIRA